MAAFIAKTTQHLLAVLCAVVVLAALWSGATDRGCALEVEAGRTYGLYVYDGVLWLVATDYDPALPDGVKLRAGPVSRSARAADRCWDISAHMGSYGSCISVGGVPLAAADFSDERLYREPLPAPRVAGFAVGVWLIVLFTSLAILFTDRLLRRHLVRCGRCVNCGYDLRASSDLCPECGTRG
jgi:hypothetical protein